MRLAQGRTDAKALSPTWSMVRLSERQRDALLLRARKALGRLGDQEPAETKGPQMTEKLREAIFKLKARQPHWLTDEQCDALASAAESWARLALELRTALEMSNTLEGPLGSCNEDALNFLEALLPKDSTDAR